MPTIVLFLAIGFIAVIIWGIQEYKREKIIAKAIDGSGVDGNVITQETQNVIEQLKHPSKVKLSRFSNTIELPDGQEISYLIDNKLNFKRGSKLNYEPTHTEWEILRGILKKIYRNSNI